MGNADNVVSDKTESVYSVSMFIAHGMKNTTFSMQCVWKTKTKCWFSDTHTHTHVGIMCIENIQDKVLRHFLPSYVTYMALHL